VQMSSMKRLILLMKTQARHDLAQALVFLEAHQYLAIQSSPRTKRRRVFGGKTSNPMEDTMTTMISSLMDLTILKKRQMWMDDFCHP
jgi:hypothetical protein